jgi:hypothetical protein
MKFLSTLALAAVAGKAAADLDSSTIAGEYASIQMICNSCEEGSTVCLNMCQSLMDDFQSKCPGYPQVDCIAPRGYGAPFEDGDEPPSMIAMRKLKQLKVLILWLQPEHRFARYCFYGCWCLPDNDHKLFTVGYGKPVDNVDASCKRQSQCYDCAQIDHGDRVCDANVMSYSYKLHSDPNDPTNHMKKSIECLDQPGKGSKGSCRRSICECDKKLSEDLREHFSEWHVGHHQEQGSFDSATACVIEGCKNGNCGGNNVECCGNLGSGVRMPYKTDGRRKCCGDKTYDSTFQECCEGNTLAAIGTC